MNVVTIHEAKTHLSRLIRKVLKGEEVVIARGKTPVARLMPLAGLRGKRVIGDLKGKISVSDDFDAPIREFDGYQ